MVSKFKLTDTRLTAILFGLIVIATVVTDWLNGPDKPAPDYLVALLGTSGTLLFGTLLSEKNKDDADTKEKAENASKDAAKATTRTISINEDVLKLAQLALESHPELAQQLNVGIPKPEKGGERSD